MTAFSRSRPHLGTFVTIRYSSPLQTEEDASHLITQTFQEVSRLEDIFSKHDTQSELSRFNRHQLHQWFPVSQDFAEVAKKALEFWSSSSGAFNPFSISDEFLPLEFRNTESRYEAIRRADVELDLGGIAKGFIVDKAIDFIQMASPEAEGVVNAGGDMRYFGIKNSEQSAILRLGSVEAPVLREIFTKKMAIATSSLSRAIQDPRSSTTYSQVLRVGLDPSSSVTVLGDKCYICDALTKVGLFSSAVDSLKPIARKYDVQFLIFSGGGELIEMVAQ